MGPVENTRTISSLVIWPFPSCLRERYPYSIEKAEGLLQHLLVQQVLLLQVGNEKLYPISRESATMVVDGAILVDINSTHGLVSFLKCQTRIAVKEDLVTLQQLLPRKLSVVVGVEHLKDFPSSLFGLFGSEMSGNVRQHGLLHRRASAKGL